MQGPSSPTVPFPTRSLLILWSFRIVPSSSFGIDWHLWNKRGNNKSEEKIKKQRPVIWEEDAGEVFNLAGPGQVTLMDEANKSQH